MKIHEYNEMMRHLTRREPSDKHLASSNPLNIPAHMQHQMEGGQLTPEEFYQNQSIPITDRPLTGAEGGRVGFANGRTLKDVIGNYSVSDLRKLGIVQPMFAWGSNEPSIITAENLQTHGDQMEPHPMSDEDWERMLMGLTDQRKLKQIEDSINIYEGRSGYKPGGLVEPGVMYYGKKIPHSSAKDKAVLSKDIIEKIKKRIKLPVGQKWNFYDPTTNPEGYTYGIRKAKYPNLWDIARNVGKEGRAESKLAKATEKYKKIKADPKLWKEKQLYDREIYLGKREQVLEEAQIKYASDKEFREAKLEYAKIQRIENPEKYKKQNSDWFAKRGSFPPGNNHKEHVWRDMFRSSQKSGQERFLLVDESGKLLTPDNFPKVNGKVRWDVDGAYKKVKFFDQETGQYVKFSDDIKGKGIGFEKYLDQKSVGGKGAFKNAVEGYKLKDDYKNLSWKNAKGEDIRLGTFMQDKLKTKSDFVKSGINIQHPDLDNAFWKNEVSTATSNMELKKLESEVLRKLRAANKIEDVKLKNIAKNKAKNVFKTKIERLPGGITKVIEDTTYGIKPTAKSVISAAGKEFGATRYKEFAKLLEQGPEGIKFLNKQAVAQTMWKLIGNKGKKKCSTQLVKKAEGGRIGFQGKVCGLAFATEKPTEYMAAVKKDKEALNAFKAATAGKSTSKILNAARWVMRDLGNPVGWIGSELIISGGITAAMLGEGYTTREAIDSGIAWFLPKSVLKAEEHKIRDMAEKEGVDFETLMPFLELESIAEEYDKHKMAHLKNTNPLYAWKPEQLEYFSSKMFGKSTSELSDKEAIDFVNSLEMPSASGQGGEFYRKQAVDSSVLGMGSANKKYSDLLRKIQKPFRKDDLRYALPYSQLDELRNVADMTQTEKAKANELASLKSQYDRGMQYTAGRGKQTSFQDWVHQQGKGDLFFNEFQRGPDRREMLTWSLFNDTGVEPYKMPFPEKAPIDFSAAPYEAGGRVGLKKGKRPYRLSRRGFLQWLAGITGAGIAAGTGLLKFGKTIGKGKTVIKAGDHIIQGTKGMPEWYIPLINRIVKEGDNVTAKLGTVEREIVHTKKIGGGKYGDEEVTVYQNLDTGNVRVEYGSPLLDEQGRVIRASNDPGVLHLEYRAPQVIDEGKHAGQKTEPEFAAAESEPRVVNWEGDVEFEHLNEVNKVDDLLTDTSPLKTFAKKKLTHKEKVIAKKKQKYKTKLEEDPSEQLDYIERKEGMTIDDLVDEEARVSGLADKQSLNPDTKLMNLPERKVKKASGGSVNYYDNYLPDIDDID